MHKHRPSRFLLILLVINLAIALNKIKSAVKWLFFGNTVEGENINYEFSTSEENEISDFLNNFFQSLIDFTFIKHDNANVIYGSSLLLNLLIIVALIMMYQLKRKGFLLYSICAVLAVIIPLSYYIGNSVGMFYLSIQFFITGLFIFLFATQLKSMK